MRIASFAFAGLLLAACSASTEDAEESNAADLSDLKKKHDAGPVATDAGPVTTDAGTGGDDGTPSRRACTSSFGSGLTGGSHGRLDGELVAIVPPGQHTCSGDNGHVHLQILMNGSVYDVAVNVESIFFKQIDAPLVGQRWSEGWHAGEQLDYPSNLNLHASDFTDVQQQPLETDVENALASSNHISLFATKYSNSGIHLVHRNGNGNDGAIITDPLSPTAHYMVFHFSNQSF